METTDKLGQIRKGFLELAILTLISARKVYVAEMLEALEKTEFKTQEGTLYPLLSRLRREGTVEYEWVESESGPPRKYYRLTPSGLTELEKLSQYSKHISTVISSLAK